MKTEYLRPFEYGTPEHEATCQDRPEYVSKMSRLWRATTCCSVCPGCADPDSGLAHTCKVWAQARASKTDRPSARLCAHLSATPTTCADCEAESWLSGHEGWETEISAPSRHDCLSLNGQHRVSLSDLDPSAEPEPDSLYRQGDAMREALRLSTLRLSLDPNTRPEPESIGHVTLGSRTALGLYRLSMSAWQISDSRLAVTRARAQTKAIHAAILSGLGSVPSVKTKRMTVRPTDPSPTLAGPVVLSDGTVLGYDYGPDKVRIFRLSGVTDPLDSRHVPISEPDILTEFVTHNGMTDPAKSWVETVLSASKTEHTRDALGTEYGVTGQTRESDTYALRRRPDMDETADPLPSVKRPSSRKRPKSGKVGTACDIGAARSGRGVTYVDARPIRATLRTDAQIASQ